MKSQKITGRILSAVLAFVFLFTFIPISSIQAHAQTGDSPSYLALGDSISTGYALAGYTPGTVPTNSFSYLLAAELGYELTNLAIDGNTASGILTQLEDLSVRAAVESADLITITAGGNDLMALFYQSIARRYNDTHGDAGDPIEADDVATIFTSSDNSGKLDLMICAMEALNPTSNFYLVNDPSFEEAIEAYIDTLNQIMDEIDTINPDVTVIIETQYNPYVECKEASYMFFDLTPIYSGMEAGVTGLNTAIRDNQADGGYIVADVKAAFDAYTGNEDLYNADITSLNIDFHPTAAGHAIIAETFAAVVPTATTLVTVSAASSNNFHGSVSGGGSYPTGESVTLTATPSQENAVFYYWLDNSVALSDPPAAADLAAAIVSYNSAYTFTASEDVSLKAVFGYTPSLTVSRKAYESADDIFTVEGYGTRIDDEDIEIGKQSVTVNPSDHDKYVTVGNTLYERCLMYTWSYDEASESIVYQTLDTLTVPMAPLYDSAEYWEYLSEYEILITVAYLPHAHGYADDHDSDCDCGYSRDIPHTHTWGEWSTNHDGTHSRVCVDNSNHAQIENCVFNSYVGNADGHWKVCVTCGKSRSDISVEPHVDEDINEICDMCEEYKKHEHAGGTATCKDKAVCEACGESYGELGAHNYENGTCTVCGEADPNGLEAWVVVLIIVGCVLILAGAVMIILIVVAKKRRRNTT